MRENRELSILTLINYFKNTKNKHIKVGFPLSSSSIRPLRILNEQYTIILSLLKKNIKIFFYINDLNKNAILVSKKNFELLKQKNSCVKKILEHKNFVLKFFNEDANIFMLKNKDFDYLEIDPFGSPNFFLNNAILSLKHKGILSLTATDTAAFTGTYPKTTLRKYFTIVEKTPLMHYNALKILFSHVFRIASSHDFNLKPLLSYYDLHFIKIFLQLEKNKNKSTNTSKKAVLEKVCSNCGNIQKKIFLHDYFRGEKKEYKNFDFKEKCVLCSSKLKTIIPIYDVVLNDKIFLKEIYSFLENIFYKHKKDFFSKKLYKKLFLIKEFSDIDLLEGKKFYHLHKIASYYKTSAPKNKSHISFLKSKGFKAIQCYFDNNIIITNADYNVIKESFNKQV